MAQIYPFPLIKIYPLTYLLIYLGYVNQIRDYIHVMDLAHGHIAALRKLFATESIGD